MRAPSISPLILALALFANADAARANQTVTACSTDTQTGSGTNLATALAAGGDIFIQCPKASVIRVTQRYTLNSETQLIGLNSATLADNIVFDGAGLTGPLLFVATGKLTVQALSFKNFTTGSFFFSHVPSIAAAENVPTIDGIARYSYASTIDAKGDVELDQVQITASDAPVRAAGAMTINHSWFGGNKGTVIMFLGVGSVNTSDFENNGAAIDFHQGAILGCTFNGHLLTAITITLPIGPVSIRNSNFSNSIGDPAISITAQSSNSGAANVTLRGDNFSNNNGGVEAGAIAIRQLSSPLAAAAPYFAKLPATVFQIAYDDFDTNLGGTGGALDVELRPIDLLSIVGGTFAHNTAITAGGAIFVRDGQLSITHSLFKANSAPAGAAIAAAPSAQLTIANSLIVENLLVGAATTTTPNQRAAVTASQLILANVTIANNQGIGLGADAPLKSQLTNLLLSQNKPSNCSGFPATSFAGPNLQFGPTDCAGSTVTGDPLLDSFYVPSPGSAALKLGSVSTCSSTPVNGTDLVFQARNKTVCALGAFERPPLQFRPPTPTQGPYAPKVAITK
jgi:predicted outer membrane repeat protein